MASPQYQFSITDGNKERFLIEPEQYPDRVPPFESLVHEITREIREEVQSTGLRELTRLAEEFLFFDMEFAQDIKGRLYELQTFEPVLHDLENPDNSRELKKFRIKVSGYDEGQMTQEQLMRLGEALKTLKACLVSYGDINETRQKELRDAWRDLHRKKKNVKFANRLMYLENFTAQCVKKYGLQDDDPDVFVEVPLEREVEIQVVNTVNTLALQTQRQVEGVIDWAVRPFLAMTGKVPWQRFDMKKELYIYVILGIIVPGLALISFDYLNEAPAVRQEEVEREQEALPLMRKAQEFFQRIEKLRSLASPASGWKYSYDGKKDYYNKFHLSNAGEVTAFRSMRNQDVVTLKNMKRGSSEHDVLWFEPTSPSHPGGPTAHIDAVMKFSDLSGTSPLSPFRRGILLGPETFLDRQTGPEFGDMNLVLQWRNQGGGIGTTRPYEPYVGTVQFADSQDVDDCAFVVGEDVVHMYFQFRGYGIRYARIEPESPQNPSVVRLRYLDGERLYSIDLETQDKETAVQLENYMGTEFERQVIRYWKPYFQRAARVLLGICHRRKGEQPFESIDPSDEIKLLEQPAVLKKQSDVDLALVHPLYAKRTLPNYGQIQFFHVFVHETFLREQLTLGKIPVSQEVYAELERIFPVTSPQKRREMMASLSVKVSNGTLPVLPAQALRSEANVASLTKKYFDEMIAPFEYYVPSQISTFFVAYKPSSSAYLSESYKKLMRNSLTGVFLEDYKAHGKLSFPQRDYYHVKMVFDSMKDPLERVKALRQLAQNSRTMERPNIALLYQFLAENCAYASFNDVRALIGIRRENQPFLAASSFGEMAPEYLWKSKPMKVAFEAGEKIFDPGAFQSVRVNSDGMKFTFVADLYRSKANGQYMLLNQFSATSEMFKDFEKLSVSAKRFYDNEEKGRMYVEITSGFRFQGVVVPLSFQGNVPECVLVAAPAIGELSPLEPLFTFELQSIAEDGHTAQYLLSRADEQKVGQVVVHYPHQQSSLQCLSNVSLEIIKKFREKSMEGVFFNRKK